MKTTHFNDDSRCTTSTYSFKCSTLCIFSSSDNNNRNTNRQDGWRLKPWRNR